MEGQKKEFLIWGKLNGVLNFRKGEKWLPGTIVENYFLPSGSTRENVEATLGSNF